MVNKPLDALSLVLMDDETLIKRLASTYCSTFNSVASEASPILWARFEFGDVLPNTKAVARSLYEEVRRQFIIRARRKRESETAANFGGNKNERIGRLLASRLGPARLWTSGRGSNDAFYFDGVVTKDLIAGLIPTTIVTRRVHHPTMLVYRCDGDGPRSYLIPPSISSVLDAFIWLIPEPVADFASIAGVKIEHDGRAQSVRLTTEFGVKLVPWKTLTSQDE